MGLSNDLISQFVKITKDNTEVKGDNTVYGTAMEYNGGIYVKMDGSDRLTPVTTTANLKPGDRVTVIIKNHTATVTGNVTSPSASHKDLEDVSDKLDDACNQISEFEIVIADKVNTKEFEAEKARIDSLQAYNVEVNKKLTASEAEIENLKADNLEVNKKLTANEAEIEDLKTKKLDAEIADIKYATVENLDATNAKVHNLEATYGEFKDLATEKFAANEADIKKLQTDKLNANEADFKYATVENLKATDANVTRLESEQGDFKKLTAEKFEANEADIEKLKTDKLDATSADLKYANIDFSNIGKAAIEQFYATSGIIKDLVIGDTSITGILVGVTIMGDLIQGGTVKADKLVVKGEDGLYYKLNTEGMKTEVDQNEYNSLNGSIITAKSITATKISVDDLVAFDATIGGFHISEDAIYSGVKASVDNTTSGLFLGSDGQMALGDKDSYLKYYKDQNGNWKFEVTADTVYFGSNKKSVEEEIDNVTSSYQKDLLDQHTEIIKECNEIVSTVSGDYVTNSDYGAYKETVESKFSQMEDEIKMDFSTSKEEIDNLNKELADTKVEWRKYIRFSENGIEIGDTDNILKLEIDNDMIRFVKNGITTGWWDGNDFHTGNIMVEVNERAQFGNFAFVPRSDGSLSFLKVGD